MQCILSLPIPHSWFTKAILNLQSLNNDSASDKEYVPHVRLIICGEIGTPSLKIGTLVNRVITLGPNKESMIIILHSTTTHNSS